MKLAIDDDEVTPTATTTTTPTTSIALDDEPLALGDKAFTFSLDDDESGLPEEYSRTGSGADYLKLNDGQVARAAFIQGAPVAADFVHYDTRTGYVRCNSTRAKGVITHKQFCCAVLPEAKPRRAMPVFVYNNADTKTGKLVGVTSVSVRILRASAALWKAIRGQVDEDSTLFSHDFVFGKDPAQKLWTVGVASHQKPPAFKSIETEAMAGAQPALQNTAALLRALGKAATDAEIKSMVSQTAAPRGSLADLDSLS